VTPNPPDERSASPPRAFHLSLVIPTRNEAATAPTLIARLAEVLAGIDCEVVFVDDSDDDTPAVIRKAGEEAGLGVSVIHREGEARAGGLSTAVLAGMRAAQGDYLLVMDADLQHPPATIHALLETAEDYGAGVVIASRYLAGGGDEGLDGYYRKAVSWGSKWLVKVLFPDRLNGVSDPLSGFFIVRRSIVEGAELRPIGFKILLDILVRCDPAKVREVPLRFAERAGGSSKAGFAQGKTFLTHVVTLVRDVRFKRRPRSG
jgi:dolichol-phosphate mannosyltransferase